MSKSQREPSVPSEPVQDPTTPKAVAPKVDTSTLPRVEVVEEKPTPKAVERFPYTVTCQYGADQYGPFKVEAVDESEAIQRTIDNPANGALKSLMPKATLRAKRTS